MWNSYAKLGRIEKAIKYCGKDPETLNVRDLFDLLVKRGMTDGELNNIAYGILSIEPPSCFRSHCKNYGGQSCFCNCALGRVPGRCKEFREYKKKLKERESKQVECD